MMSLSTTCSSLMLVEVERQEQGFGANTSLEVRFAGENHHVFNTKKRIKKTTGLIILKMSSIFENPRFCIWKAV